MNPAFRSSHASSLLPVLLLIASACSPEDLSALSPQGRMDPQMARPEPYLVQDIRLGTRDAFPFDMRDVNGTLYFTANDGVHGRELWKSDGTEAGTALVKDLIPGAGSPEDIKPLGGLGNTFFFGTPQNLWKTDGTAARTVAVREGQIRFSHSGFPLDPVATLNGSLFFFAYSQGATEKHLWRTDGTDAGTVPVSGVLPIGMIFFLENVNGTLLFTGRDINGFIQLWRSDGTAAGTTFVGNLPEDLGEPRGPAGDPLVPQVIGGTLFFTTDSADGPRLWKTDGTLEGTVPLTAAGLGSSISELTAVDGTLFFLVGGALWRSDGTSVGTVRVNAPSAYVSWLGSLGGALLIGSSNGLYRSDGTPAGTTLLKEFEAYGLHAVAGDSTLFFMAGMPFSPAQLWKSDGTAAGTTPVTPISLGTYSLDDRTLPSSRVPFNASFVPAGNLIFFLGNGGNAGHELWRSDGTSAGTFRASDINLAGLDAFPQSLTTVGDKLFFTAFNGFSDPALWMSNGTGAVGLKAFQGEGGTAGARHLAASGGKLFFSLGTLWVSDGTEAGTVSLGGPGPTALLGRNGTAFFTSGDFVLGKSDGTRDGTVVIKTTDPCCSGGAGSELVDVNGTLYFTGATRSTGSELWKSNGTAAGTVLVKDIYPGESGSIIGNMTTSNGRIFFHANGGFDPFPVSRQGLWTSDGTAQGTRFLETVTSEMVDVNGTLFFASPQGLSRSDGTLAGTRVVKEFKSGVGSYFSPMTAMKGAVYFMASDDQTGWELWRSDGTEAGTVLVKDIRPGTATSWPLSLTHVNGLLYFLADADGSGHELWRSDGTEAGTFAISTQLHGLPFSLDLPGAVGDAPRMAKAHGTLYFVARDVPHGQELWALPLSALTCPAPLTVEATSNSGAVVSYPAPTVAPDATGMPSFTYDPPAGRMLPLGATQVSVSASSLPPYSLASCDFTVTVRDSTPPVLSCPAPQVAKASSSAGGAVLFPAATASDAVTASPVLHYSQIPGSTFLPGTTEVTVTATDDAGNTASCGFTVTVELDDGGGIDDGGGESSGCGCGGTPPGMAVAWLLLLVAPLARSRSAGSRGAPR
jgi:ELWxxDGT repeat protein